MIKDKKWIWKVMIVLGLTMILIKVFSLRVLAADRSDLQYYGDFIHEYDLYLRNTEGGYNKIHVTTDNNTFPILIYFTNWKSLRLAYFQFGQASSDALAYEFSNDFGNSNVRSYVMNVGINSYEPYMRYKYIYQTNNNQTLPLNTDWYVEGLPLFISNNFGPTVLDYLNCVNTWYADQKGGDINASIDTTNIEQLLASNNQLNETRNTNLATITQDVGDIKNNGGSGSGLTEEEKKLLQRYDIWLVLIMMCVGLSLFRQVLHQTGRNIRGR